MIVSSTDLLRRNAVYYPCFDPAYPIPDWKIDFRILPLLFDYIIVPSSHILENTLALKAASELAVLYKNGICIGSVRKGQHSIQEFYSAKVAEFDIRIPPDQETAFLSHGENYRILFHRDTESQSAAFRYNFLAELNKISSDSRTGQLLSSLPSHGVHLLHRERLDKLISDVGIKDIRCQIEYARNISYFAAGAAGNMSHLYDPMNHLPQLASSYIPREAYSYMSAIFKRAGVFLSDIERIPLDVIAGLAHSSQFRIFRQTLIGTIKKAEASYSDLLLTRHVARKIRNKKIRIGIFLANLCFEIAGFYNVATGIGPFLLTSFGLDFCIKKILDAFDQLTEPMLVVGDNIAELIDKEVKKG